MSVVNVCGQCVQMSRGNFFPAFCAIKRDLLVTDAINNLQTTGRVSSEDEKRVCSSETRLQREHIIKNFNCPTRE